MRRDMDLIRLILLEVEGEERVDLSSYSDEQITEHKLLIYEAKLAEGEVIKTLNRTHVKLRRLLGEGHDFLTAARNETVWRTVKETVAAKGGSIPFAVLHTVSFRAAVRKS